MSGSSAFCFSGFRRELLTLAVAGLVACASGSAQSSGDRSAASSSDTVSWPTLESPIPRDPELEARIDDLLAQMTLEEKIGQMIQPEIKTATPSDVREYHLGSVLNGGGTTPGNNKHASVQDWVDLADAYYRASVDKSDGRTGVPIMWGTDAVHGLGNVVGATLFPHNIGLGATRNSKLLKKIGEVTAREIAVTGLDWDFSPTVAVARDDRWGRAYESWSENPEVVKGYAGPMIEGLQGDPGAEDFLSEHHVIATAKHYIGDGGTDRGVDRGDTLSDEKALRDIHGAGYFSAIESGVQVVMASYSSWQGQRMHGHEYLLTDVLKQQMGFDGFVVGDWNGHGYVQGCSSASCPKAVNAGLDMFMAPGPEWKELYRNTLKQVRDGTISRARIDDAVRRILRVKLRAGLFEKGVPSERELAGDTAVLGSAEHRAVARQAVRESLVMLKNQNQLLPLNRNQRVLVAGDGADSIAKQSGGWSVTWQGTGNVNSDFPGATSIFAGVDAAVTAGGGEAVLRVDGEYEQKPDVAIVVFGESPYAEVQGDRSNLAYSPKDTSDLELLKRLQSEGIPVVSLFITGRPLWVNRELNASDAFVVTWLPGSEGGGIADVIFRDNDGDVHYPMTGELPFSWPERPDQTPLNVGEEGYDPLFPFGYGLAYGEEDPLAESLPETGLQVAETEDKLELFKRRPLGIWGLEIIGAQNDRKTMTSNTVAVSTVQIKAVDRNEQWDARQVTWNGEGAGQVALFAPKRQDWTDYLADDAALIVDLKVDRAPTDTAWLRFGCGSYCASDIDLTQQLREAEGQGWQTLSVDLSCFPTAGANFGVSQPIGEFITQVLQPFSVLTEGELTLAFTEVSLEKHRAADATLSCH
ncbi:glycoside hydrolase family 3 protein [Salinisphaera sp. USBA-960]|nr:glycoside hydrolase family 3 protein [Salifodinibacter halophilus]NNC26591.1 glycoside hydrolase family 3 protein [Salifodinibacter halophilus]